MSYEEQSKVLDIIRAVFREDEFCTTWIYGWERPKSVKPIMKATIPKLSDKNVNWGSSERGGKGQILLLNSPGMKEVTVSHLILVTMYPFGYPLVWPDSIPFICFTSMI